MVLSFPAAPPTRFPTPQGVNFHGSVRSPHARQRNWDCSEISQTDQQCCSGCFRRILSIAHLTTVLVVNIGNWVVEEGGWVALVDVGNMGESRTGVTEGGQECEQGMLGNQQVSSCVRVCIPPCYKDRLWVTRGQVCTENQMFFSAQIPVSSQISSLMELVQLSWF